MKRRIGFVIALLCVAVASLQNVHAETLTVPNNGDDGGGTDDLLLNIGPNVNVSREHLNESETQIAINPANPLNLFAVSNHDYEAAHENRDSDKVLGKYSMDDGRTWKVPDTPVGTDPPATLDPGVVFDNFGNLFVSYIASGSIAVLISRDGGKSFPKYRAIEGGDFPALAVGPMDDKGHQSIWVSYAKGRGPHVVHAEVTGQGDVGPFSPPTAVPLPAGVETANFGNIAVGPQGQVAMAFMDSSTGTAHGPGHIYVAINPDSRTSDDFQTPQLVTTTNWGWYIQVPSAYNYRGTSAQPFVVYDNSSGPFSGRLYLSYLNSPEAFNMHAPTPDTDVAFHSSVYVRHLDRGATRWSEPVKVSTGHGDQGTAFLPSISVDPISGLVGATWYDSHKLGGDLANLFAAFSDTGGQTFSRSVRLSKESSRADRSNPHPHPTHHGIRQGFQGYGDYARNAFYNRKFYASWADNSNSTGDNPDGETYLDLYTARVDLFTNARRFLLRRVSKGEAP